MSLTRDMLATLEATVSLLRRGPQLPAEPASARMVRALAAQDAPPAKPPEAALAQLRHQLLSLAKTGGGYAGVPTRELRHAPWLLWTADQPLATLPGLLDELITRAAERKSLLRALIEAWLMGYAAGAAMIREAAQALRRLVFDNPHPSMEAWASIDRDVRIFDVPAGPLRLAQWLLAGKEPVEAMLARIGFDDPLRAVSGYMRQTQEALLGLAPERLVEPSGFQAAGRIFAVLAPGGTLRFSDAQMAGQMARALLKPWLAGGRGAGEGVREAIQEFLVAQLGDPRLRPRLWSAAGEDAVALMRRWLTKASLDAFFRLIREHALDSHWTYREAFWAAYLKAGAIADAWLAFASAIHAEASSIKELRGAFGRLDGGVQPNHSVLLLRIGDLVFCEWSHNGALRAWRSDWKTAPQLARSRYSRADLVGTCLPFPPNLQGRGGKADGTGLSHIGSSTGYWQGSVANLIARHTNIHLTERDYMPK